MKRTILFAFVFCLVAAPLLIAQEEEAQDSTLIEKAFTLKYADAKREAYTQVRLLSSPMGRVIPDERSNSILVRDTADVIKKVEALLARIDVPPHRLRLTVFAVKARKGGPMNIPKNLAGDVKASLEEVSKLLNYSSYELIDSGLLTLASDGRQARLSLSDNLEFGCDYSYSPQGRYLSARGMRVDYQPEEGNPRQLFRTDIGIGDGEVVVAGVSRLNGGDEAILTILTLHVEVPNEN